MKSSVPSRVDAMFPILAITRDYSWEKARRDAIAGLTVALFTIPQAMAYALIAGFPPTTGIYTAIVASILGAIFGSSEFLINGPTNAISVMIASNIAILASQGDPQRLVILLTLMIGISQCFVAAFKAGALTRFVSEPVLIGFTAGAGIYIAVNQLPAALGLEKNQIVDTLWGWKPVSNVVFDLARGLMSFGHANLTAIGVATATVLIVRVLQMLEKPERRRVPATFVTVVIVSLATFVLGLGTSDGPTRIKIVQDIEPVTRALPHLQWPDFSIDKVISLIGPTFAIGLLGAVEAIAIGKALAADRGHRFSANRQLVGEGACNIGAALVGGFASSGSFTRTAVNFDAGAVTRWSCILSGVFVLGLVLAFAPMANYIPVAVLAGLLIHIGLRLMNMAKMRYIFRSTNSDKTVMIATFASVLIFPQLEHALFIGVGLSLIMALRRAEAFKLRLYDEVAGGHLVEVPMSEMRNHPVVVLDLQGELFFATAESLEDRLNEILHGQHPFVVLRLQQAYNMDITCADALIHVSREAQKLGGRLILSGVRPGTFATLQNAGVVDAIGADAVFVAEATLLGSTMRAVEFAKRLAASTRA